MKNPQKSPHENPLDDDTATDLPHEFCNNEFGLTLSSFCAAGWLEIDAAIAAGDLPTPARRLVYSKSGKQIGAGFFFTFPQLESEVIAVRLWLSKRPHKIIEDTPACLRTVGAKYNRELDIDSEII